MNRILLVGASGRLGGAIANLLLSQSGEIRALVRRESDASRFSSMGADAVIGDLKDRASLTKACRDVHTVITTANAARGSGADTIESVDIQGTCNLIDAASQARVRRFVYVSAYGASMDHPAPLLAAKAFVQTYLRDAAIEHTIIAPNMFMDVWVEAVVGAPVRNGEVVHLPGNGKRKHSMVAARDVARLVTAAVDRDEARNAYIPVGGPSAVSWSDVISAYERILGKAIDCRCGSNLSGMHEPMRQLLCSLETFDSPIDMSATVALYGLRLTTIEEYVAHSLRLSVCE